ncbi:hypothetical protein B0H10DRAFT_1941431 [Mycena sp. CBHHK59/15]|nr:hypothetical protein B0H10DRAFT_1941431 [Mycena sp. CBHHK59/15]
MSLGIDTGQERAQISKTSRSKSGEKTGGETKDMAAQNKRDVMPLMPTQARPKHGTAFSVGAQDQESPPRSRSQGAASQVIGPSSSGFPSAYHSGNSRKGLNPNGTLNYVVEAGSHSGHSVVKLPGSAAGRPYPLYLVFRRPADLVVECCVVSDGPFVSCCIGVHSREQLRKYLVAINNVSEGAVATAFFHRLKLIPIFRGANFLALISAILLIGGVAPEALDNVSSPTWYIELAMAPKDVCPAPRPLKKTKVSKFTPDRRQGSNGEEDELDVELSRRSPVKVSSRSRRRSFTPPPPPSPIPAPRVPPHRAHRRSRRYRPPLPSWRPAHCGGSELAPRRRRATRL